MASPASDQALPRSRGAGTALTLPRLGELRPYLLLALLTALVLTAAYAVRPVVRIDMGGDYDAVFLRDFHGREIDAAAPPASYPWAPGQEALAIPGRRPGVQVAVLRAAPGLPPGSLIQAAVAVNGVRVDMPRRTPDSIVAAVPPELAAADEIVFTLVSPLTGDPPPPPDLVGEVSLAPARTYRWSQGESQIVLPNLGRGAWTVALSYVASHPDGQPLGAELYAGQTRLGSLPETGEGRRVQLLVPPSALRDGTLELTIRTAKTFADPRPLGLLLSDVVVAPAAGGSAAALPPLGGLGLALLIVLGAFASLVAAVGPAAAPRRGPLGPQAWVAIAVALAVVGGGWALMAHRFPVSFMLPRLAWLALWSLLMTLAARPLIAWLFRAAGAPLASAGPAFLPALLLLLLGSYWLKAVGMLYPYFVAIDVQWHMDRALWVLDGRLPLLYGTSSPLNDTTMPTAEWGENRPVIPYSPWFHMLASTFVLSPMSMATTANMISIILDSSRLPLIALIARKAGLSPRVALIAVATYAVTPVTYLLHSWGNVPTTYGLWLTLVCTTIIFAFWERLGERRVMVTLSAFLLATFLLYTVTGVFMGVFLVGFTLLAWLNARRGGEWSGLTRQLRPLWTAAGVAIALALLIYYGQYILPIIQQTVPYLGTVFTQGPESVGVQRPPFSAYLWRYIPHMTYWLWPGDYLYYGVLIPMIFTVPGFFALRSRPLIWTLFAAWLSVAVVFFFAGYRISMVDKQLFYMLPVMCICWAICADWAWGRWAWGRWLVLAVLAYTLYAAVDQWVLRIVTSPVAG